MSTNPLDQPRRGLAWVRMDAAVAVLLAFPLLLLALRGAWFFNQNGGVDDWLYTGYFRSLRLYVGTQFRDTYYGSRLPWIAPGYLLYKWLGSDGSHLALHLIFYTVGLLASYFTLKPTAGRRAALLGTLLYGAYPWTVLAHGWDYPDGGGMTYFLVGMACLTAAARMKRSSLGLMAAGVAGAACLYTQVLAVPALLGFLSYYPVAASANRETRGWREGLRGALWMTAGGVLLTVALGLLNLRLGGGFLFYLPTVNFGLQIISSPNPWYKANFDWPHATWLYAHVFGAGVGLFTLASRLIHRTREDRPNAVQLVLSLNYLGGLCCYIASELYGRPDLQSHKHLSYIVPTLFLIIGANLGRLDRLSGRTYAALAAALALILALPYASHSLTVALSPLPWWLWGTAAGIALLGMALRGPYAFVCRSIAPWVSLGLVLLASGAASYMDRDLPTKSVYDSLEDRGEQMRCVCNGWDFIHRLSNNQRVRVWYNDKERRNTRHSGSELAGLFMWGYIFVNRDFPDLSAADACSSIPQPVQIGEVVVVVSGQDDVRERTTEAFAAKGQHARYLGAREFREGTVWLPLSVFQIEKAQQ